MQAFVGAVSVRRVRETGRVNSRCSRDGRLSVARMTVPSGQPAAAGVAGGEKAATALDETRVRTGVAESDLKDFLELFTGEWDSYDQILQEHADGFSPREGGGHEHIHAQMVALDKLDFGDAVIFAKYYFDGDPESIFRIRMYAMHVSDDGSMWMRIYRLCEKLENDLRDSGYDYKNVDWMNYSTLVHIEQCDVLWSRPKGADAPYFEGIMKEAKVFSPRLKQYLSIKDELTLNETHLTVNDRGLDEQGNYIYGNIRGIPYIMRRVTGPEDPLWWTVESDEATRAEKSFDTTLRRYDQKLTK